LQITKPLPETSRLLCTREARGKDAKVSPSEACLLDKLVGVHLNYSSEETKTSNTVHAEHAAR
jgi:hypothetical protein